MAYFGFWVSWSAQKGQQVTGWASPPSMAASWLAAPAEFRPSQDAPSASAAMCLATASLPMAGTPLADDRHYLHSEVSP